METTRSKNPKRVEAGKRNRQLRGPITQPGLDRLRTAARANRPWEKSTGPITQSGKAIVARNGKRSRPIQSLSPSNVLVINAIQLLQQMKSIRQNGYLESTHLEFRKGDTIATELSQSLIEANELLTKSLVDCLRSEP